MLAAQSLESLQTFLIRQGERILERLPGDIREKPGAGLVTALDESLEADFRIFLHDLQPDFRVVGEERGGTPLGYTWWLDPLDGTTNYVHGWPRSAISLALYHDQEALLALVYDPYRRELFRAQKGLGSWCNDRRLQVGDCLRLEQALLTTGFAPEPPAQWEICRELHNCSRGLRVSGCAALDLAYVAAGRVDAFWEVDLKPWDVAAGLLLVREAGGLVSDFSGAPAGLLSADYLAANRALTGLLRERLSPLSSD